MRDVCVSPGKLEQKGHACFSRVISGGGHIRRGPALIDIFEYSNF